MVEDVPVIRGSLNFTSKNTIQKIQKTAVEFCLRKDFII